MFDFRPIALFCLEKRLSKHKMTIFFKILWGDRAPLTPSDQDYGVDMFNTVSYASNEKHKFLGLYVWKPISKRS